MNSIQFHPYGFIVGLALVIAIQLIEFSSKKLKVFTQDFIEKQLYILMGVALGCGIVGARVWHVVTDFHLYSDSLIDIFEIWNGGLSILGGVLGAVLGIYLYLRYKIGSDSKLYRKQFARLLDVATFGLPVGQFIGRLANYVNQELYGLPYDGLFKLYISSERRLPGFESISYYHPLFAYEMIFTGLFAGVLYWHLFRKPKKIRTLIGTTKLFQMYVLYYAVVRFFLDFLRIERGELFLGFLGFNQVVLLLVVMYIINKHVYKN